MELIEKRNRILTVNNTTFEATLASGDKVEIGDKDSIDFKPHIKLNRWSGECSLTLSIPTTEKILPTIKDNKILWTGKDYGAEFYQGADGFKFNIILSKKPKTNVFPLEFNSNNLTFHYQPPLTAEFQDGWSEEFQDYIIVTETSVRTVKETNGRPNGGVSRPENVIGSYAVYHATKGSIFTNKADAEKYKSGIAFHWYRPLIYDNAGNQCWGVLNVNPKVGIRTVTIPQDFLDNAVYPVTIDDLFGYDTLGGTDTYLAGLRSGSKFACPALGTGISISWGNDYNFSSDNMKCCLYDAAGNKVDDGETEQLNAGAAEAWVEHDFLSPPTLSIADYWLLFWQETANPEFKWDTVGGWPYIALTASWGAWPASIDMGALTGRKYSIYCTYEEVGIYLLAGVTKDKDGAALATCECFLFKDNLDDTLTYIGYDQSDGSGNYSFTGIIDNDAQYIVVAWKDNTPHVFDVSDHVLEPVV